VQEDEEFFNYLVEKLTFGKHFIHIVVDIHHLLPQGF
jgi:hypothetical protein